jgi:glutathione S-transferase
MKLYWSPRSPFVRKAMACAHELGLADRIETVYALVALDRPNPEMMRVNPLGRIPALITDDGDVLYDSTVICRYLDTLHEGEPIFPRETARRWDALRRHALADGTLETAVLWLAERKRPPQRQSPELLANFERKIRSALAAFEGEARGFESASVDIGHLCTGCALGYLDFRFPELDWRRDAPQLARWYERFAQRPALQYTQPYQE